MSNRSPYSPGLHATSGAAYADWSARGGATHPFTRQIRNFVTSGEVSNPSGDTAALQGGPPVYPSGTVSFIDLLRIVPVTMDRVPLSIVVDALAGASEVAEASTIDPDESPGDPADPATNPGGYKPESSLTFGEEMAIVQNVATWVPTTRNALLNATSLANVVDTGLRLALRRKVESGLLVGTGTNGELRGLVNTPGVQTEVFATDGVTTARKALTTSRNSGLGEPTAYFMSPSTYDVLGDDDPDPFRQASAPSLHRKPVVFTEGLPSGQAFIGNLAHAAYLDRGTDTVTATRSHSDWFVRNVVAVLGEVQCSLALVGPPSFVVFSTVA